MSSIESKVSSGRALEILVAVALLIVSTAAAIAILSYGFSGYHFDAAECLSDYPHLAPASCDFPVNFIIAAGFVFAGGCRLAAKVWGRR